MIILEGLSTLVKEFSAAARIMQSSSKELSTLVADRVQKMLLHNTFKIPLAKRGTLVGRAVWDLV